MTVGIGSLVVIERAERAQKRPTKGRSRTVAETCGRRKRWASHGHSPRNSGKGSGAGRVALQPADRAVQPVDATELAEHLRALDVHLELVGGAELVRLPLARENLNECADDAGIELAAGVLLELGDRLLRRASGVTDRKQGRSKYGAKKDGK